jgi:hypothetical protein
MRPFDFLDVGPEGLILAPHVLGELPLGSLVSDGRWTFEKVAQGVWVVRKAHEGLEGLEVGDNVDDLDLLAGGDTTLHVLRVGAS